jgi:hypothetical protein
MAHNSFSEFEKIVKARIDGKSGKSNPKSYSIDGIRKITRELRRIRRNQGIESKFRGRQIANSQLESRASNGLGYDGEFVENYGMSQSDWERYQNSDI